MNPQQLSLDPGIAAAWFWQLQANREAADTLREQLAGSGLAPEKVLAWAHANDMDSIDAAQLMRLPFDLSALDRTAALARSRTPGAMADLAEALQTLREQASEYRVLMQTRRDAASGAAGDAATDATNSAPGAATSANDELRGQAALSAIERDFALFKRALGLGSLEGAGGARQLGLSIEKLAKRLQKTDPGAIAKAASQYRLAYDVLLRNEESQRRDPTQPGTTAASTDARLAKVSALMAQYRVPVGFRNIEQQVWLLDDVRMIFNQEKARFLTPGVAAPADIQDGTFPASDLMRRFASLDNYIDYLKASPSAWQGVAENRLNKKIIFAGLQEKANNQGVLQPAQMREIELETDSWRRLYLFREAATGIDRLKADWADLYVNASGPLNAARPTYTPLVDYYLQVSPNQRVDRSGGNFDGMDGVMGGNPSTAPKMPREVQLMARTMDFAAQVERQVVQGGADPGGAAHRTAIASVDERIAMTRAERSLPSTASQHRQDLGRVIRALEHLKARITSDQGSRR